MSQQIIRRQSDGTVVWTVRYSCLNDDAVSFARQLLEKYKKDGVLIDAEFDGDVWPFSDEKKTITMRFSLDKEAYEKGAKSWTGVSLEDYLLTVKTYAAMQLGTVSLASISSLVKDLMALAVLGRDELMKKSVSPHSVSALLFLPSPSPERERFLEDLECCSYISGKARGHRVLDELTDFLHFNRKLDDFWKKASDLERILIFPYWAWWHVTVILPLRPTEFILTPRDCIKGKPGAYTITIRRSRLKKRHEEVTYRIASDYECFTYSITDDLALPFLWYIEHSSPGKAPSGDLLLGDGSMPSYASMRTGLRRFIAYDLQDPGLSDRIHLGDTRHLAMIGLIVSGGSPSICKVLADHETIGQSSWYFANVAFFIASAVFRVRSDLRDMTLEFNDARTLPPDIPFHQVPEGKCDAMEVLGGDISACITGHRPGSCLSSCTGCCHLYSDPDSRVTISADSENTAAFDKDFLIWMMDLVRMQGKEKEMIREILSRLRKDCAKDFGELLSKGGR